MLEVVDKVKKGVKEFMQDQVVLLSKVVLEVLIMILVVVEVDILVEVVEDIKRPQSMVQVVVDQDLFLSQT